MWHEWQDKCQCCHKTQTIYNTQSGENRIHTGEQVAKLAMAVVQILDGRSEEPRNVIVVENIFPSNYFASLSRVVITPK